MHFDEGQHVRNVMLNKLTFGSFYQCVNLYYLFSDFLKLSLSTQLYQPGSSKGGGCYKVTSKKPL